MGSEIADGVSDSECIVLSSKLGEIAKFDPVSEPDRESIDKNRNNYNWEVRDLLYQLIYAAENLSAHESQNYAALPESPVGHKQSSSGSSL